MPEEHIRGEKGHLTVTVLSASLKKDYDVCSKNDPYCVITYDYGSDDPETHKTMVLKDIGREPVWN